MKWLAGFRVFLIICVAVTLIALAVLFSALRASLPFATGYKQEIQAEISRQIQLPIEIDSLDAAIHWFSPALRLIDVTVYDEQGKESLFTFEEAFVQLDILSSILRGEIIVDDVGLIGTDITIEKYSDNEWSVQGLRFGGEGESELPERFVYMLLNSDYLFHDLNIHYREHTGKKLSLNLKDVNVDVENSFNHHDVKFTMRLPAAYGDHLAVVASLYGDFEDFSGEVFVEVTEVNARQWNSKFGFTEQFDLDARINLNAWLEFEQSNLYKLVTQLDASPFTLRNTVSEKQWATASLSGKAQYINLEDGWYVAVSDMVFGSDGVSSWPVPVNLTASYNDQVYRLNSNFLRLQDLQAMLQPGLSDAQQEQLGKLSAAGLMGDVYNLSMQVPQQAFAEENRERLLPDNTLLSASVSDLAFVLAEQGMGFIGVDADIDFREGRVALELTTRDAIFDFKDLFKAPLKANLVQGLVTITHDGNALHVDSQRLQLENDHASTESRFRLVLPDKGRIFVDAQTDFSNARGKYTREYLPVGIMGPKLVSWLEMAILDGDVPSGSFILHGHLDSFPYRNNDGIFQVHFEPRNVRLRYLEDWPVLNNATARVRFENMSLFIEDASATTGDNIKLFNATAVIPDLKDAELRVESKAAGSNPGIQQFVWNSGLDDILGDTLRLFTIRGDSLLDLGLDVALNTEEIDVGVAGMMSFNNAELDYPDMGYSVRELYGDVSFTRDTITAEGVKASIDGRNAVISAKTRTTGSGNIVNFSIDGNISTDYLTQRYEWIPVQWLSGRSDWSINVSVPYSPSNYIVRVKANSLLNGSIIDVSDKVFKPADGIVTLDSTIKLLGNDKVRADALIRDEKKQVLELDARRDADKNWVLQLDSNYLTGRAKFNESMGKDTPLSLDADYIDLHSLLARQGDEETDSMRPSDFPPIQVKARSLDWRDWSFTGVELDTSQTSHGMVINTLKASAPGFEFDSRGTWLTSWRGSHETVMQGTISGNDCGSALESLGYPRSLDRCEYDATFNTRWPAEPYRISWGIMKGNSSFRLDKGTITDLDPGTGGRLIGLLNIFKLANRLSLDFDDVTTDGFAFDYVEGRFEFVNGKGSLSNVNLSAPAADISMFGRVGLLEQDYDLLMRVKPHTDSLTFASGALFGGVTVGAGLALLSKVIDIGGVSGDIYSITGGWDAPQVEQIIEATVNDEVTDDDF